MLTPPHDRLLLRRGTRVLLGIGLVVSVAFLTPLLTPEPMLDAATAGVARWLGLGAWGVTLAGLALAHVAVLRPLARAAAAPADDGHRGAGYRSAGHRGGDSKAEARDGLLGAIHDTLVDGVVTMDAGGVIRSVNPAMTRIFGFAADEMVGRRVDLLMPADVAHHHDRHVKTYLGGGEPRIIGRGREEIARRKDGTVFPIYLAVSRMTVDGQPLFTGIIHDTTVPKSTERALMEANRLQALAEEVAHVGHWYLRPDTGEVTWSDEVYRIHGLDKADFTPTLDACIQRHHVDDRAAVTWSIRRALETRQGFEIESRLIRPDGALRTVRLKGVADPAETAAKPGLMVIIQDITQRKGVETALAESVERFHDYARAASDWFWEMDAELRFTYVSDRFSPATGLDPAQIVGRRHLDVAEADPDDARWRVHLDDLRRHRPIKEFVYTVVRPDGERRHFRISGMPFYDGGGGFSGYRGIGGDITASVATERALQESEARFRDLIEGSIQGVLIHRDFKLLFANGAYAQTMGFASLDEAMAQPTILETVAPENRAKAWSRYKRLIAGHAMPGLFRERYVRKDSSEIWVDLIDRVVTWNGEPAVQVTLMDATDRVHSERELEVQAAKVMAMAEEIDAAREEAEENRRKAEAANAAKSRFLAMMSHELRTPLTGIMGVVDLLLGSAQTAEQRTLLRTLKDSAETLLTLLNDVLDFSKIEAGQLRLESIDFAPARIADDVLRLFGPRASEKGLVLVAGLPQDVPAAVRGDPTRLRQVLFNLAGNAVKFTENGRVEINLTVLDRTEDAVTFRFEVKDSGIGMTPEQIAGLFRPFTQADESTTRRFGGTGLGLAICKRLVETMGGVIGVESTPGRGSAFWFTVRLAPGDPAAVEAETTPASGAPAASGHGLKILLAEDNEVNRMVISAMLARMGHEPHSVADGCQAVAAVEAEDWDMVLMDMQMPEMDGMEATRVIRRLPPPKCRLPIVALTADALPEHRASYMRAGLDDFLTKPVDWDRLAETLRSYQRGDGQRGHDASVPHAVPESASEPTPEPISDPISEPAPASAFDLGPAPAHELAPDAIAVLDPARLDLLRFAIGTEALDEMLGRLPTEVGKRIDGLTAAIAAGDLTAAKRAAHQLRGLVGTFGATRLEAWGRIIEEQAGDIAAVASAMAALHRAVDDTLTAFTTPTDIPEH